MEQFGFPLTGTETRCYTNHALSYDQSKRVPRWVLEHISKSKILGRWLEVKELMKDISRFRTRRIIEKLNLFHVTAPLGNDDVCMAHYIDGPCPAAREPQALPSCLRGCEDPNLDIRVEGSVINIAAVSTVHSLSPRVFFKCLPCA